MASNSASSRTDTGEASVADSAVWVATSSESRPYAGGDQWGSMPLHLLPLERAPTIRPRFSHVTPQHLNWLDGLVKAVIVLNLLDLFFTLVWVGSGHAEEANVLLHALVREHPVAFVATKISLVSLGSFLLWKRRGHPLAVIGIVLIFLVYYVVLLYHLRFTSVFFTI